jgi:hypothetical protein
MFKRALADVFPKVEWHDNIPGDADELLDLLYEQARCGAFHDGQTRWRVLVKSLPAGSIAFSAERSTGRLNAIVIDCGNFLADIEHHFALYIHQLRNPENAEIRAAFTATWERAHAGGLLHVPPDV